MQRCVGLPAIAGMLLVGCSSGAVGGGGGTGGDGSGEVGLACAGVDDCEQWFGPAPCGAWSCAGGICQVECADCTDPDKDGYGSDPACAGPDCDENDGTIGGSGTRPCYTGPTGTDGVGACQSGVERCQSGVWIEGCVEQTQPQPETCNTVDDDCNGTPDDDSADADCEDLYGPSPCGAWSCATGYCSVSCPNCTDADGDGYGTGGGCAGRDCDDADPFIHAGAELPCYSGPDGTEGVGVCTAGLLSCTNGVWSSCTGEVVPDVERCNGLDDNCDGVVDGVTAADQDCEASMPAAPCNPWVCDAGACRTHCPGCTDADGDGYGPEAACAGKDCDDLDPYAGSDVVRACYNGPLGTRHNGACRDGQQTCTGGTLGPCIGQVTPSGEACNDVDDDCDGAVDEDLGTITCDVGRCATDVDACQPGGVLAEPGLHCPAPGTGASVSDGTCDGVDDDCDGSVDEDCAASKCVWVVDNPAICGTGGAGTSSSPFGCIQDAIDAADPGLREMVCVTATTCLATTYDESPTMREGVHVIGDFDSTMTGSKCGGWLTDLRTRIAVPPQSAGAGSPPPAPRASGVYFGPSIVRTTILEGFQIVRANAGESAAVTVDGAAGVVLRHLYIPGPSQPRVASSYGVNLINGGEAVITRSRIFGGSAPSENIAVRSVGSRPTVIDNCESLDGAGRCTRNGCSSWCCSSACGGDANEAGLYGRWHDTSAPRPALVVTVWLEDSPGALVAQSAIDWADGLEAAAIRIHGDAEGTVVRGNIAHAFADFEAHALWADACAGAAPWIVDNWTLRADGYNPYANVEAVRIVGDCHPVIEDNLTIQGGSEGGAALPTGIYCGADATGASRCTILDNGDPDGRRGGPSAIQGSSSQFPSRAVGVRCDDGACLRIEGNIIRGGDTAGGAGGAEIYGLWLENSSTFVNDNEIIGGCGIDTAPVTTGFAATGVYARNSYARLQNNRISAGHCGAIGTMGPLIVGLHVAAEAGPAEIDVHSNLIDGGGDPDGCTSVGLLLEVGASPPARSKGVYRNNVILAGNQCLNARYNVLEGHCAADPRLFEHNALPAIGLGGTAPTAIYHDVTSCSGGSSGRRTASEVDAMTDARFAATLDVDPRFGGSLGSPHLEDAASLGVSPLDGAGTPDGAPTTDMDGDARSSTTPDIGPDECVTNDCTP